MPRDDDLIARAKTGDGTAWSELYEIHAGRLLVWLRHQPTGDAALAAEDLLAEAWLVAATKIADFTGSTDSFGGWLFTIARSGAMNTQRKSRRRATTPAAEPTDGLAQSTEDTLVLGIVADDSVRQLLARLPPRERDVITCTDVVGLDTATTAQALGMSRTAVRVARHRGLARLRG